jgi:dienelactone hydrolase
MRAAAAAVALAWCIGIGAGTIARAQPVPFAVTTQTAMLAGAEVMVDVYRPVDNLADGVAVLAHGFTRDRTRDRDLGRDLAEAGVVAIAPDLPNLVDYWGNGDAVKDVVDALERGAFGIPPTPRSRIVLIGTSAGAVATVIAAAKLPGVGGWIGLDPVDRSGTAARAAAKLTAPAVVLLGEPSVCNLFGSGKSIARASPGRIRTQRVHGASHCDFEGPTNNFCRNVCGKSSRGMDAAVRREAVAAALGMLHESPDDTPSMDSADGDAPAADGELAPP